MFLFTFIVNALFFICILIFIKLFLVRIVYNFYFNLIFLFISTHSFKLPLLKKAARTSGQPLYLLTLFLFIYAQDKR